MKAKMWMQSTLLKDSVECKKAEQVKIKSERVSKSNTRECENARDEEKWDEKERVRGRLEKRENVW